MTALALALVFAPTVTLVRLPKVGDKATYEMRAIIDLGGRDDVKFTGTSTERIKSIEGGLVTTSVESRTTVDVMGVARESRPIVSDRLERLGGGLMAAERVDETVLFASARVDRLRAVFLPTAAVAVGGSWWRNEEKDAKLDAPPFSSYLRLVGEEKIGKRDAWQVSLDANEVDDARSIHVKGMVWLDKSDGSLVRGQWTIDGFTYGATDPPGKARLEIVRKD